MAKRGAIDLEFDAVKARLNVVESYIQVAEKTVHFTVDEARALLVRIDDLESALGALLDEKTDNKKEPAKAQKKEPK